jgi:anti-sigma factor RsiW
VTHPSFAAQLDAYLDGELAAGDARELETHLGQCSECTRFRDGRLALRAAVVAGVPTFQAPAALRERIWEAARGAAPTARAPHRFTARNVWRPLALAASLAVVALGSWTLALQRAAGEALADDVLASHIRSLMPPPGHLTDVASSDQHTVKPWFNGRLDFSPPVYDFAGRGYPLVGGRLDYVGGRPVGALVYGRRQHLINVFIWPATRGPSGGPSMRTRQGYHELHWTTGDYTYWVVSDLGLAELQDFAQLLRQA